MTATIELREVSRWFGDIVALTDVTLDIGPGVTSLLGPNGAGKTTLLRIVTGMARPSSGTVRVLGRVPGSDATLYRDVGVVRETDATVEEVTARRLVRTVAALHGVPDADARASRVLDLVDLDPADRRPLRTYSKGMRQRVQVAQALVHEPEVVVLDEPLNGLDPHQRAHLTGLIRRLGDEGRTVLVSSHVLAEVERFGERVLVLADGRLAAAGGFRDIRALMDDRPHRLRVRTDRPRELAAALVTAGVVTAVRVEPPDTLVVDTGTIDDLRRSIAGTAQRERARLSEVVPLDDDLESVFRYLLRRTGT